MGSGPEKAVLIVGIKPPFSMPETQGKSALAARMASFSESSQLLLAKRVLARMSQAA
jgi:hypothetical protein